MPNAAIGPIDWGAQPSLTERAFAVMLLQDGRGWRRQPSKGDEGVDVVRPLDDGYEVIQIKSQVRALTPRAENQKSRSPYVKCGGALPRAGYGADLPRRRTGQGRRPPPCDSGSFRRVDLYLYQTTAARRLVDASRVTSRRVRSSRVPWRSLTCQRCGLRPARPILRWRSVPDIDRRRFTKSRYAHLFPETGRRSRPLGRIHRLADSPRRRRRSWRWSARC